MTIHRFAWFLAAVIFCLLILGGIVHNTGSSLACPDWPTCHGTLMPEMTGGVAIEHSHRLLASSVGLLTIILSILLYKKRRDLAGYGLLAVFLVVFQGVLGGITVLMKLPSAVSTTHLATSFLFFALVITIAWKTSPDLSTPSAPLSLVRRGARGEVWIKTTAALVYLQCVLGAFMRHTGAGLVCPDIPFCYGSAWPSGGPPMLLLHMVHRWMGVVAALAVFGLPLVVKVRRGLCFAAMAVVLCQIGLGVASVLTQLGVVAVTAHLGGAALLWGIMVSLLVLTPGPSPATGRGELRPVRNIVGEGV